MGTSKHLKSLVRTLCFVAVFMLFPMGSAWPSHASSESPQPLNVSMVALVANPEKYDGKFVRTIGFMCLEYEGDALYLREEDFRFRILKDAFALRLSQAQQKEFKNLSLKHVIIEGTVYANGPERWDYAGAIGNVTRLEYWRPRGDVPAPSEEPPSRCGR